MILRLISALAVAGAFLVPASAAAQDPVLGADTVTAVADTIPQSFPVPRGAFIRALIIPGWGHLYVGQPKRGAVYFALQGASWFMLGKTLGRLGDARDAEGGLASLARDSLAREMAQDTALARELSDPLRYEQVLETYPGLTSARSLVRSRERHRQDWIVYTIFFTFAGAVDAYVTAHMADFPVGITAEPAADGGMAVGMQLRVGRRP